MNPDYYSIVEMVFTGAVVLGLALWQLWSVNREIAADKKKSDEGAGHAVGEHGLDEK